MSTARELILLSPYRLPTQSTRTLGDDDVAAFLNGCRALWHPAAASQGGQQGRGWPSPYDHEQPQAGHLYAVPTTPPPMLPEDWDERVGTCGKARHFRSTPDREETLAKTCGRRSDEQAEHPRRRSAARPAARARAGRSAVWSFGLLIHEALCEAMSHDNLLATGDLWIDVGQAIELSQGVADPCGDVGADPEAFRTHLQAAAARLLSAREVLYSVSIYLVDLFLPDPERPDLPWPLAFERGSPLNVVLSSAGLQRLAREQPARLEDAARGAGLVMSSRSAAAACWSAKTRSCRPNRNCGI